MSEMSNKKSLNKGVKGAGTEREDFSPSRCTMGKQHGLDHHLTTARRKWLKEDNKMAILSWKDKNIGCRKILKW